MRNKWIGLTGVTAFIALAIGPQGPAGGFWGAESGHELGITGGLASAFFAYGLIEAIGFGLGIAWLAFGRKALTGALATPAYLAMGWLLASWWPHGGFHQAIGEGNHSALVRIEFGFHATMILAGAIIARYLWLNLSASRPAITPQPSSA